MINLINAIASTFIIVMLFISILVLCIIVIKAISLVWDKYQEEKIYGKEPKILEQEESSHKC